jgi:hypothetical protein
LLSSGGIVTASFGVASTTSNGPIRTADLIAGADASLYAAKGNGRNQVWPRFLAPIGPAVDIPGRSPRAI